jgi:uncharacterized protein (DUF2147 family)
MQGPSTKSIKMLFFCLTALAVLCLAPFARAQTAPEGWWLDQTGKGGILIAACGNQLCGRLEWLQNPDVQGKPKTDSHNPDAALQSRPLCGLTIVGGFSPDGSGGWTGGWVYDPQSGKTYKAEMHIAADGTLHLRGYIGIPMLGRTAVWTRPPAIPPQCSVAP